MRQKIGKDSKVITIVREEKVSTNSDTVQKGDLGNFPEDIKEVIIPDGITAIEENAFEGCVNLTSITFPASLKHIVRNAFIDCKKLETVVLPDTISSIVCWGERRVWKTDLDMPFADLVQHLTKGHEVELNPPVSWE